MDAGGDFAGTASLMRTGERESLTGAAAVGRPAERPTIDAGVADRARYPA
ncbi:hypothetical protein ACFC0D_09990 [Streptomyces sp. NPDC056222]